MFTPQTVVHVENILGIYNGLKILAVTSYKHENFMFLEFHTIVGCFDVQQIKVMLQELQRRHTSFIALNLLNLNTILLWIHPHTLQNNCKSKKAMLLDIIF